MTKVSHELEKGMNIYGRYLLLFTLIAIGEYMWQQFVYNTYFGWFETIIIIFGSFIGFIVKLAIVQIIYIGLQTNKKVYLQSLKRIIHDWKQIILFYVIYEVSMLLSLFFVIPLVLTIVLMTLFMFVWQVFIFERERGFGVLFRSMKLVGKNIKDLGKYIVIFITAAIVTSILNLIGFNNQGAILSLHNISIVFLGIIKNVVIIFGLIVITNLYIDYCEHNIEIEE